MNRDQIIQWARECGTVIGEDGPDEQFEMSMRVHELERFAAAVRAAALEQAIDIVAMFGGSVEIEAAIRSLASEGESNA